MRITSFFALSTLALFACRSDSNNNTDGNNNGDGTGSGGAVKIQDVQNDAMPPGTAVTLHGVVVTAIDKFGAKTGDFWVEEPEGGAFSGIHVFMAQTSDVAALNVGDIVDISGAVKDEFALTSDTTGRTITELKPAMGGQITVTKTGTGTVPAPQVVDALMYGQLAETSPPSAASPRSMAWEQWEGVLIQVNNVTALNAPACVGTACSDPTLENFSITGDAVAESSLAAFPVDSNMKEVVTRGLCMTSITGVEDYFFDYLILPRQTSEVNTTAGTCPVENSPALCSDNMDNDGNGFTDCQDIGCITGDQACRAATTVAALDAATTLPTGGIELDNVYVTAISFNKKNLWVSDTLAAGQGKGIYISYGTVLDSQITVGSKVNVVGVAKDYNNDTMGEAEREVQAYSVAFSAAGTTVTPIAGKTAAQLSADHSYVGSLVTLTNVKVTSVVDTVHYVDQASQSTTMFFTDDDIFRIVDMLPVCYATVTGIWSYQVFNNGFALLPTAAGTTTGGVCP